MDRSVYVLEREQGRFKREEHGGSTREQQGATGRGISVGPRAAKTTVFRVSRLAGLNWQLVAPQAKGSDF